MFTGIIEEIGHVKRMLSGGIIKKEKKVLEDVNIGDSIAVNGVCLTVTSYTADEFTVDVMPETLRCTNLGSLKPESRVNLERAMAANGRFGPENIGVPTDEIWQRVEKSLKAVGMYGFRKASPSKLSGGQKQRVAIASIVAMKPKCIVLDEPTAMLDPIGRKEVIETLRELNRKEGVTIILITHYMEEVIDADRIYVMDEGKLVMQGTPRQIFSQVDRLKELRLDVPQVTELAYELKKSGIKLSDGILTTDELIRELEKYKR